LPQAFPSLCRLFGTYSVFERSGHRSSSSSTIAHFAIGAIMLKRGWMLRYMPPIVAETIAEYVTFAGYGWAARA